VTTGTNGAQQLQIKPGFPGVQITLGAGPRGANALPALGLMEGTLTTNATAMAAKAGAATNAKTSNSLKANYALGMPSTLNLTTAAGIKQAQLVLGAAVVTIKQIYTDMTTPAPAKNSKSSGISAAMASYLAAQSAGYKGALARLQSISPTGG